MRRSPGNSTAKASRPRPSSSGGIPKKELSTTGGGRRRQDLSERCVRAVWQRSAPARRSRADRLCAGRPADAPIRPQSGRYDPSACPAEAPPRGPSRTSGRHREKAPAAGFADERPARPVAGSPLRPHEPPPGRRNRERSRNRVPARSANARQNAGRTVRERLRRPFSSTPEFHGKICSLIKKQLSLHSFFCGYGVIGSRARLRIWCLNRRGGSSPFIRTARSLRREISGGIPAFDSENFKRPC